MSLYQMLSPYLFKLDSERAHNLVEWALKHIVPLPLVQDFVVSQHCVFDERLNVEVAGIRYYNHVGLAAGFDKNATMVRGLSALGFGFLELGTVTQAPQIGNAKPRLFRYEEEKSLQNAMGFNNQGSLEIAKRLKNLYPYSIPLGINVGKNKNIMQSDSLKNYENVLLDCLEVGDYFVFNLSSPNTPKLRDLQNVTFVQELFKMARTRTQKPLFLKISPDMDKDEMLKVVEMSIKCGASGIIATNTTIDYSVVQNPKESGGVSGEALREKSKAVLKILSEAFFGKTTLISVGGISNALEAYKRIKLGASLLQVYSGLIFQGPRLCRAINEGILELLAQDGFANVQEAIGHDILNKPKKRGRKSKSDEIEVIEGKIQAVESKRRGRKPKTAESAESAEASNMTKNAKSSVKKSQKASVSKTKAQDSTKDTQAAKRRGRTSTAQKPKNTTSTANKVNIENPANEATKTIQDKDDSIKE